MSDPTMEQLASLLADVQLTREAGGSTAGLLNRHPALAALLTTTPGPAHPATVYLPVPAQQAAPARPWGKYLATAAAGTAVAVPFLATVTALLLAVGLTAVAIGVCALVCRWIIADMRKG